MAQRTSRPTRTLVVFLLVIGAMYAGAGVIGNWKPKLGLDLQGGTRITLQARAEGGGGVTEDKLSEASDIISNRVNGAGIAEAEVTTQGSDIIIVEIPGQSTTDLARQLGSTAQLRFRLVELALPPAGQVPQGQPSAPPPTGPTPTPTAPTSDTTPSGTTPSGPGTSGTTPGTPTAGGDGTTQPPQPSATATPNNRVASDWFTEEQPAPTTTPTPTPTPTEPTSTDPDPAEPTPTGPSPTTPSTAPPTALTPPDLEQIQDPLTWQPDQEWQAKLAQFSCPGSTTTAQTQIDIPSQPLLACSEDGTRYLLGPAIIEGTQVTDASAGIPQQGVNYVVNLEFDGEATDSFTELTTAIANQQNPLTGQQEQFAIVLDGEVLSAPVVNSVINNGRAIIEGSEEDPFTQESATALANSLKYGALPLSFTLQSETNEGPELAGNQLDAGVVAGVIGLLLVVVYCMFYYRGLGLVVIASLGIAGAVTYAAVLLLSEAYGFTLTLPGIAGLIVAIGITADSFIVYFERLRDEVREGKTLRTAVETGWVRARATILAADAVSMLAAVVLFIFAIGVVKGFAFALGLTTFIDAFIVFFFTKPMVTLLSRTKFFGRGHKLSGLDRAHLGMPVAEPRAAGGEA